MSLRGEVPGVDARDRAVRLAGALAELGEKRIVLVRGDGEREELAVRGTDLPGAIVAAGAGAVLECGNLGLIVRVMPDAFEWEATRDEAARTLIAALCR